MDLQIIKLLLTEIKIVKCHQEFHVYFVKIVCSIYNIYNNYYNVMSVNVYSFFFFISILKKKLVILTSRHRTDSSINSNDYLPIKITID